MRRATALRRTQRMKRAAAPFGAPRVTNASSSRPGPAENKNLFVMKRDRAAQLGISTLSQAAAQWPAASG
jgi:hypothetical protein